MGFDTSGHDHLDKLAPSRESEEVSKFAQEGRAAASFHGGIEKSFEVKDGIAGGEGIYKDNSAKGSSAASVKGGSDNSLKPEGQSNNIIVLESCNSTWVFDTEKNRFRRVLKGPDVENSQAATDWHPYYGLELDDNSEYFAVALNKAGTRILRSWRHLDHCHLCGGEATTELSLDDLRSAILG
jgi:hypothetical protein